jgi:hypothetical protein
MFLPHTKKSANVKQRRATVLPLYVNRIKDLFEKNNGRKEKIGIFRTTGPLNPYAY